MITRLVPSRFQEILDFVFFVDVGYSESSLISTEPVFEYLKSVLMARVVFKDVIIYHESLKTFR